MGCLCSSNQSASSRTASVTSQSSVSQKKPKLQFENKQPHLELPFNIQTPPIINNNQVIFLASTNNKIQYITLDLTTRALTTDNPTEIKCDDSFDIFNTTYTFNPNQNKIYFLENNKDLLTLDLNANEIISLNKSISTTNGNYAAISYSKITNKMYIFGAENESDIDDNYIAIPYSSARKYKGSESYVSRILKFGQYARVIDAKYNGSDWIFIAGGQRELGKADALTRMPNDVIWHYIITNDSGYSDEKTDIKTQKWQTHFLALPTHSYGLINYENRFLMCFGGELLKHQKMQKTNVIYILPLKDGEYGEYGLKNHVWYELERKLPIKEYWHGVYNKETKDVIHLFTYNGLYYTLAIKDILDELKGNGVPGKQLWTEQGKTVLPTKSKSIKNVGPKLPKGGDVSDDD